MKKFKLFKLLALFVVLITSINTAWADLFYYSVGTFNVNIKKNGSDNWIYGANGADERTSNNKSATLKEYSAHDEGVVGTYVFDECWIKGYATSSWDISKIYLYYKIDGAANASDWGVTSHSWQDANFTFNGSSMAIDLVGERAPGNHTFEFWWKIDNNSSSNQYCNNNGKNYKVNYIIPGFTETSFSADVNNATVNSTSSTTISFGQHYGTALSTTSTKTFSGADAGLFSVTSISETGVTVQFAPTTKGTKTARLTITDAHGKTCIIDLTGKTQYTVTYAAGTYGTGLSLTDNKVFGEDLTLADAGYFTRTGYHQTAWNTNAAGTGGDPYSLNGTYEDDAAITLYPTWTANDYTIAFDPNDANYVGTATGTTASINATYDVSYTLTSNGFERAGYTFAGWTTNADGTGNEYTDAQTGVSNLTSTNEGSVTLYAKWTENLSAITINTPASYQGSLDVTGVQNLGVATTVSVTASFSETGYMFDHWEKTGNAVLSSTTDNPVTISADGTYGGTGTVTAVYVPRFAVVGTDKDGNYGAAVNGMPGTSDYSNTLEYYAASDLRRTLSLKGNTKYKFHLRDLYLNKDLRYKNEPSSDLTINDINAESYWLNDYNHDVTFTVDGTDELIFNIVGLGGDHVRLHILSSDGSTDSYTVSYGSRTFYGDETDETSTEGGTVAAVDWKSFALATEKKVKAGTDVTFTATPKTGYNFAGWYSDETCSTPYEAGDGVVIADNVLTLTFNANKTVYAKFVEKMTTVNLTAENGTIKLESPADTWTAVTSIQAGVHTKPHIKAVPDNGYYFTGWVRTAGSDYEFDDKDFETEADSIVNVVGRGNGATSGQTLTAKFEKLEKIYFRNDNNNSDWDKTHIYAYFNVGWNNTGVKENAVATTSYHAEMSDEDEDGIYVGYVPRAVTKNEWAAIAFSNEWMGTGDYPSGLWDHFYGKHGVYRTDYNQKLNMYVLKGTSSETSNTTQYYNNGYWMNYGLEEGAEAGYTLERYSGSSDNYRVVGKFFATDDPNIIKFRFRMDSTSTQRANYNNYIIRSAGNIKYKPTNITIANSTSNVTMSETSTSGDSYTITPTRLGYYVLTIDQSENQMKVSVDYPLAVGDYILEHTYVNESGTTIKTHSDVIKYDSAANVTRYSMFLSKSKEGSTSTLKLRQCTNAASQTWSAGDATNLSSILTQLASDGNGVYQFDLSVDKTNNRVDEVVADSTRLYTGKYYIKTDSITGGWINYKRNALEHNTLTFKASNANSFDYYYCKFFYPIGGSGANPGKIKCVIANDYCNAVSDTLFGDEIATGSDPTVPSYTTYKGTSIRFSYNSTTNQLKRTYLGASTNDYYLDLKVSTDNMVYKDNSPSADINLYTTTFDATWANRCRFEDTEDWVYEKVVKVIPGGKGGIVAKFDDTTQELLEIDHLLLGCQDGGTCTGKYDIRLVYDFKTNYLMASWIPGGPVSEKLENVDMLWERVADNSAQQISFSGSGSLEKVKVVGAIRFDYDSVHYSASGTYWTNLSTWSPESRRWLKYFVSFPFDVPVSSVFGLAGAELGRDYIIQKYNGDKRAKEGLYFGDGGNFWENLTKDSIMHANEGYCVIFDNDYARGWYGSWWNHKKSGSHVYLYFPAKDTIASITGEDKVVTVAQHKCNINRYFYELDDEYKLTRKNHIQTDSHWNLIGTPQFHDAYIKSQTTDTAGLNLTAYYYLDYSDNKWKVQSIAAKPVFKAMHSYWVQWAGTIEWTTDPAESAFKAPARNQKQARKLSMKLNLMYNGKATDWTYLEMAENADEDFKLCEDLCKVYNQNSTHIYTYAGDYDVAYNKLPIAGRTVNVGVDIYRNGTYTFAMPDNFDGVVILVDNVTGSRTNLAAGNYEVYLNKGTYNSRFSLEIGVNSTPTEINDVQDAQGTKARKMMIDGVLYIVKDNVIYDARGNRVQ